MSTTWSDTAKAALDYHALGWQPIPIPARSKNPNRKGWQNERRDRASIQRDFTAGCNIGVLTGQPSGWLVDIDLDHPLAVEMANQFLPATPAVFGRAGKPRSHRLYRVSSPVDTMQLKVGLNGKATTVVELRSTGGQTVFPPSVHPSGESVAWENGGGPCEPAEVEPGALRAAIERLHAAVLEKLHAAPPAAGQPAAIRSGPGDDRAQRALTGMLRIRTPDGSDGSKRLFAAACRAVEWDLTDGDAITAIRAYAAVRPFPTAWTDKQILDRVRSAEKKTTRGLKFQEATEKREKRQRGDPRGPAVMADEAQFTDMGNAKQFADAYRDRVRYCHPWCKWLAWDGKRWKLDDSGAVELLAKELVRSWYRQAAEIEDSYARSELIDHAKTCERASRLHAMVDLARSEPGIPVRPDELDRDGWLLNVANGTIDLRKGELRPHRQADMLTKLADVEFRLDAEAPVFVGFLDRIFSRNAELVGFNQRLAGYCLTGDVGEQVLTIFYGTGANGKSTLLGALLDMLGSDYAMKAASDLLLQQRGERHPTALADLHGKRLVVANETDDGCRLAESLTKELTGGDTIRARRMREDFWQFHPTHKIILATNHKPEIRGTDYAIWRRIRLVPFNVAIPEAERDKRLPEKLRAELPGILLWAVLGCEAWRHEGLGYPGDVQHATEIYREEQDQIGRFLADSCVVGAGCRVRASDLLEAYRQWTGDKRASQRRLGRAIAERGFERFTNNGTWYSGVGLATQ